VTASLTLPLPGDARGAPSSASGEEFLIARCLRGETECFRPLVERHERLVFSVALRMLGSRADAEDVAQQAFVDAFSALERFRGEGRSNAFATWVLSIAVNRAKDVLKSKKRTEQPLDTDVAGRDAMFAHDPSTPEANAAGHEQRAALAWALLQVAPKYRAVLVLKDVEELPFEEIRQILGLPLTTLKIRAVRARAMMREALARYRAPAQGREREQERERGPQR
jgi:RNA polymerase sigma-70 factor (ECF subfamily)